MAKGIVVDHKETDVRYAISEKNFNKKIHTKVRDLRPGESVIGFTPKPRLKAEKDDEITAAERQARLDAAAAASIPVEPEEQTLTEYTQEEVDQVVEGYTLDELKDLAKEEGLSVSGTKAELAASLLAAGAFVSSE